MSTEEINRRHEEQIRILDAAQPRNRSLVDRLATAEAELHELSEQIKEAYRRYAGLQQQMDVKAGEVKELRFEIREASYIKGETR